MIQFLFYLLGSIFFFSALAFAGYAFGNARHLRGGVGHQCSAIGGCLFMVAAIVGAVDHFLFPGSGMVYAEFAVWVIGLAALLAGGWLRAREVHRVSRAPLVDLVVATPYARRYLLGVATLLFVSIPISLASILSPLRAAPEWFNVVNLLAWTVAFLALAASERGLHVAVRPAALASVDREREILLRDDILAARVYAGLIDGILAALVPLAGIARLRDVVDVCATTHEVLERCRLTNAGRVSIDGVVETLTRTRHRERLPEVLDGFSSLASRLIDLYSAFTSSRAANRLLTRSYAPLEERYRDVPVLLDVLKSLPPGFLEEKKLALLSKEELEARVRERTTQLEEALLKAAEAIEAMKTSQANFRSIVERSADGIVVLDREGTVRFANPAAMAFLDRQVNGLLGKSSGFPINTEQAAELEVVRPGGEPGVAELRVIETEWRGDPAYLALLRDVTERKRAEEQIRASLQEKEVLLKEIHHRVKNNLQVISSLLLLQSGVTGDERVGQILKDSRDRIHSMAVVHETLYRSENLAQVDFTEYIRELLEHLHRSHTVASRAITLRVDVERVSLDIDAAIYCGMIVNELVTNALRHAFPGDRAGEVCVALHSDAGDQWVLVVSDDGVGLPPDVASQRAGSLGLRLVAMLTDQLDGSMTVGGDRGTTFRIAFSR